MRPAPPISPQFVTEWAVQLPNHTQLPETNGSFVKNYQEPPQGDLLTDCITPILKQLHPDGNDCIGRDCGIYWRLPDPPAAPEKGAEAPDWFYIPNVPPTLRRESSPSGGFSTDRRSPSADVAK